MEPSLPAVFGAGVLSFASPCVLPMVPIYLATLAGGSVASLSEAPPRGRLVARASAFAAGLAVPFVLLGLTASTLGRALSAHRGTLSLVGGALLVLFALRSLGILRVGLFERDARPGLSRVDGRGGLLGAFLFGAAFGVGWTPCVGPVLGAVLTWTAQANTSPARGALTLGVYALGIALPLVVAGAFAPTALRAVRRLAKRAVWIERATGLGLAATGVWLISQNLPAPQAVPVTAAVTAPAARPAPCASEATGCGVATGGGPVGERVAARASVVEFMRRDCAACAAMAPVISAAERRCGVSVRRVVVDDARGMATARAHGVAGVPTFVAFDAQGAEVTRFVGVHPQAVVEQTIAEITGRRCGG